MKRTKVEKTLNGLSIGGFAKRVPITEMRDGELVANVPEGFSAAQKRAVQEAVAKAEGDPALAQFVDLRVEEVSLVDAAANEEEFFIIKRRRDEMPGTKKNEPAADPKTTQGQPPAEPTTKANPESTPETPPTPTPAEAPAEPTIAEQVAAGVEAGGKAALEAQKAEEPSSTEPTTPEPEAAPVEKGDEILAELKKINDRIDGVEAAQKEQGVARAVAKGQSAPEGTEAPSEPEPAKKSKWAGTAVHSVFAKDAK